MFFISTQYSSHNNQKGSLTARLAVVVIFSRHYERLSVLLYVVSSHNIYKSGSIARLKVAVVCSINHGTVLCSLYQVSSHNTRKGSLILYSIILLVSRWYLDRVGTMEGFAFFMIKSLAALLGRVL